MDETRPGRDRARRRLVRLAALFALLSAFSVAVWLLSGRGAFWPAWVLLSSAFVVGFQAVATFTGDDPPP